MIVVGGMIGLGKTSVSKVLGEHFNAKVYYENVDNNPILPLFYSENEQDCLKRRYPFLLQLFFLNDRFTVIKEAFQDRDCIIDRSIYEDWYFAKKNAELGRISDLEMSIYENLLNNMMEELKYFPKKSPDLMIYLKGSYETVLKRIELRGRDYELNDGNKEYYYFLWEGYDRWLKEKYNASDVLVIDMDKMDIVNNEKDRELLIKLVEEKLAKIR